MTTPAVHSLVKQARNFNRAIVQSFRMARTRGANQDLRNYWIGECTYARYQRQRCMIMARKLRDTGSAF